MIFFLSRDWLGIIIIIDRERMGQFRLLRLYSTWLTEFMNPFATTEIAWIECNLFSFKLMALNWSCNSINNWICFSNLPSACALHCHCHPPFVQCFDRLSTIGAGNLSTAILIALIVRFNSSNNLACWKMLIENIDAYRRMNMLA